MTTDREAEAMIGADQLVQLDSVCLADVQPEKVDWLWQGRIPYGKLTIIEGHPGVGKSHLTIEIAARVSRGDAVGPDGETIPPGNVALLTAEDGVADTVRPRADAANGNVFMIHVLDGLPSLPADIPALREYVERMDIRLLIIDPLAAYLGGKVDSWKDHDVRRALAPLAKMAEDTHCAVIVVRHLTKASNGAAITAGGGSIGIIGQARCAMLVAADPENPNEIVLAVVKSNLAQKPESLKFQLVTTESGWAKVEWIGTSPHTADALIASGRDSEESGELHEAMQLLSEWLKSGPQSKSDIIRSANDAKISTRTIERAKLKMGVVHKRTGFGPGSRMIWQLPPYSPTEAYIQNHGGYEGETEDKAPSTKGLAFSPALSHTVARTEPDYLTPEEEREYFAEQERLRIPA